MFELTKPENPTRTTIRPSDLTFGLSNCKRCLWLFYWFKLELPKTMPLVAPLSALQEKRFRNADLQTLHPSLPRGVINRYGMKVMSKRIIVDDVETRWSIAGKYDLLASNEDGTATLIDCKVSSREDDQGQHYSPQLEAYVFALENPLEGLPQKVSNIGLLKWKPDRVLEVDGSYAFAVTQVYEPVERNLIGFERLLFECIAMLEGPLPEPGEKCALCKYLNLLREL